MAGSIHHAIDVDGLTSNFTFERLAPELIKFGAPPNAHVGGEYG